MSGRLIVLLTSIYPFDSGEEFIEGEIEYLAAGAEKIIVIPVHTPCPNELTRHVPENVEVRTICGHYGLAKKATTAASSILRSPLSLLARSPKKYLIESRFLGSARARFEGVRNALKDVNFDEYESVVFYSYWLFKTAAVAVWMRDSINHPHARAVSRAHRADLYAKHAWGGYLPARRFLVESLDAIYPISEDGRRTLIEEDSADPEKIEVHRLASKYVEKLERTRPDRTHIVSVSSILPVKRLDLAADAVAEAVAHGVDLKWTHIGDSGAESLQALKDRVEELGISDHVDLKGRLTNDQTMQFLRSPDITAFMNTSSSEGVPVSIMEAIGNSLPVLCTNVGGSGELIRDGVNGWLLDVNMDASEIADRIEQIDSLSDEDFTRVSRAARETWDELCVAERNYTKFVDVLAHL